MINEPIFLTFGFAKLSIKLSKRDSIWKRSEKVLRKNTFQGYCRKTFVKSWNWNSMKNSVIVIFLLSLLLLSVIVAVPKYTQHRHWLINLSLSIVANTAWPSNTHSQQWRASCIFQHRGESVKLYFLFLILRDGQRWLRKLTGQVLFNKMK